MFQPHEQKDCKKNLMSSRDYMHQIINDRHTVRMCIISWRVDRIVRNTITLCTLIANKIMNIWNILMKKTVATISSKNPNQLKKWIDTLLGQVDYLHVYIVDYEFVPYFLKNKKIIIGRSENYGDYEESNVLFWCDKIPQDFKHIIIIDENIHSSINIDKLKMNTVCGNIFPYKVSQIQPDFFLSLKFNNIKGYLETLREIIQ